MTTVIGIPGSLREGSLNRKLLQAARELAPKGLRLELGSIAEIPLYNGELERAHGIPPAVEKLKARIAAADGLLLATPEYNNSIPGGLKNTLDWLSRPPADIPKVFGQKPVALTGATPGRGGTRLAQAAWLPVLRALGTRAYFGKSLAVGGADKVFDGAGRLADDAVRDQVTALLDGFLAFIESSA